MTDPETKRRRGCLFYLFVVGGILAVALLVVALVSLSYAKKMLSQFTDTQPASLPEYHLSTVQLDELQERVAAFQLALNQHRAAPPLTLNSDEINAEIASNNALKPLRQKVYVMLEGDRLKAQMSVPMADLGLPFFKGRYLNGTATLGVHFQDGDLRLTPEDLVVKGRHLPRAYMERIRKQNLVRNLNTDSRTSIALEQLQKIEIQDGKLTIVPKSLSEK